MGFVLDGLLSCLAELAIPPSVLERLLRLASDVYRLSYRRLGGTGEDGAMDPNRRPGLFSGRGFSLREDGAVAEPSQRHDDLQADPSQRQDDLPANLHDLHNPENRPITDAQVAWHRPIADRLRQATANRSALFLRGLLANAGNAPAAAASSSNNDRQPDRPFNDTLDPPISDDNREQVIKIFKDMSFCANSWLFLFDDDPPLAERIQELPCSLRSSSPVWNIVSSSRRMRS